MLKDAKVKELQAQHGLPAEVLNLMVDDVGIVDTGKLGVAVATLNASKSGQVQANAAEIDRLKTELKETELQAKEAHANKQALVTRMIQIKSRIFNLGGRP